MLFVILLIICLLVVAWIVGEVKDIAWLRFCTVPVMVVVFCAITAGVVGLLGSMESSTRHSGAVKRFVGEFIKISEQEGDVAAMKKLREVDSRLEETYENGRFLKMLSEPFAKEGNDSEKAD